MKRAESLTKDRHWDEALVELDRLPAALPPEQAAERDYQIGMTKFHMRRDYAKAGELLLATVPHLSGDKAASAAFHGARALSRADRDDEAIAGYRKVVAEFPHSRYAAEAQYLSGWLEYNRGRFKESLPALQATLDHFGTSAFADDAAWCLAFAHFLLGDAAEATAGLERYARIPATGITDAERGDRVAYWRARFRDKLGAKDGPASGKAEALEGYRALARRAPLSFYGLLARARLKEAGQEVPVALPPKKITVVAPGKAARDPIVARAEELADAGMDVEAGNEIERDEKGILQRAGGRRRPPGCWSSIAAPTTFIAPTTSSSRTTPGRWRPIRTATPACASSGRRRSRAPMRRWSIATGRRPATPSSTSTRSCARSRGSIRTTSRTPTPAASCR